MHGDGIETLPAETIWLGTTPMYPHQAFRVGACSWAVQFHPEIGAGQYNDWVDLYDGDDPVWVERLSNGADDFASLEGEVLGGTVNIASRFAALVHSAKQTTSVHTPEAATRAES